VGGFVFGELASDVSAQQSFLADDRAADLAAGLRTSLVIDAAVAVTALGSGQVAGAVVALAAIFLLVRREVMEGVTLLVASLATYGAVNLTKAVEARPRPTDGLVETQGASFPSGHAAYSVAFVAVMVALVRALPGFTGRVALVVGAIVLAAVIGLSRVLLAVHYLSDVLAGWGLSAAIFAGLALVAMIVAYMRHNDERA
jgi:undecaprenyl-diphosphatase